MSPPLHALIAPLREACARRPVGIDGAAGFADVLAVLATAHQPDGRDPLATPATLLGLTPAERTVVWAAAAPELDANVGLAYERLGARQPACTVGLALELAGVPTADAEAFGVLGADSPLRRARLVEVGGTGGWLRQTLTVPEPVLAVLAGAPACEPDLAGLRVPSTPVELPGAADLAAAVRSGVGLVWIRSSAGAAGSAFAARAIDLLGVGRLTVDLGLLGAGIQRADVLRAAVREALLSGRALVLRHADALADQVDRAEFTILERAVVPVLAVAAATWDPDWSARVPLLVDAPGLGPDQRSAAWTTALTSGGASPADAAAIAALVENLRLTPEGIVRAAGQAARKAALRGEHVTASTVRDAARALSSGGRSATAAVSTSGHAAGPDFGDLVLPAQTEAAVRQLIGWARHRERIDANGPLRESARGLLALFEGPPGTGKTLAANVVANELAVELLHVDLTSVIDKYIGETEKNLEKVFQAAESLDVVLFFDEADALFGARSEVKDSRDRYANQEVAYLLQRMERHDGLTILATNLRANLDHAFLRRFSLVINFPTPDPGVRRRLWRQHLDRVSPLDPADLPDTEFLATVADLAGGEIRNVVRAAALDAVSDGRAVGMRDLAAAARAEYRKLARIVPAHGFVPPGAQT